MEASAAPHQAAEGVLAVLAGAPLHQAAARTGMGPADLAEAIEAYQAAGSAALQTQASACDWYQVRIRFTDWNTAERTAADLLGPLLRQAEEEEVLAGWWFIRKAPCWRLRCKPGPTATRTDLQKTIDTILENLATEHLIEGWWQSVYEPETLAFGGTEAMSIAHTLFHADSRGILDYLGHHEPTAPHQAAIGRRELSLLLCSSLFRGAAQERYEQGDIWHRVAQMRPLLSGTSIDRIHEMTEDLHRLMAVDTRPTGPLFTTGKALAFTTPWVAAFNTAGRNLANTAHCAPLRRGIRDVLAHHVIFHWNRLGLPARTQAVLARAACDTAMTPPGNMATASSRESR